MKDDELGFRDLAKSMLSCAWAISIFGMRQMTSLLTAPGRAQATKLAQAVDKVTDATTGTFDDSTQTIYRAGTSIQNAVIDVTLGGRIFDTRRSSDADIEPATPKSHAPEEQSLPAPPDSETGEDWTMKIQ